jgi:hypothetical protein
MYAGHGQGDPCSGCDDPILSAQIEYEMERDGRTYRFHLGCAGFWDAECRRRGYRKSKDGD